jgi:hypothetical protein
MARIPQSHGGWAIAKTGGKNSETVFTGGGGDLTLAIHRNQPGYLLASFSRGENEKEQIEAEQDLAEGDPDFKIDLPEDMTYGYLNWKFGIPR